MEFPKISQGDIVPDTLGQHGNSPRPETAASRTLPGSFGPPAVPALRFPVVAAVAHLASSAEFVL